mgnify:FL=1
MTQAKHWPEEMDGHRRRAIKYADLISRLGDKVLSCAENNKPKLALASIVQIRRRAKAVETEMIRARQRPRIWPRLAENARLDSMVACEQILRLAKEAEMAAQTEQPESLALLIGEIQVKAQEIELRLSQVE